MNNIIKIFILIILFLDTSTWGQIFAPDGATWYYNDEEMEYFQADGYTKYSVLGDTIIDSLNVRNISVVNYKYNGSIKKYNNEFLYINDSLVYRYYFYTGKFHLIYDFTLKPGDTLKIDFLPSELCDSHTPVILDRIDTLQINGKKLINQHFTYYEIYSYTKKFNLVHYSVIERIGNFDSFCKLLSCNYEGPWTNISMRCYKDNDFEYVREWLSHRGMNCESLIDFSSRNENSNIPRLVSFEASSDEVYLKTEYREFDVFIYNSLGKLFLREENLSTINIESLPEGIYFLRIIFPDGKQSTFKFYK